MHESTAVDQSIARIKKLDESNPIGVTETFVVYGVLQDTPHSLEFPNDIHDDITKVRKNTSVDRIDVEMW